MLQNVSTNVYKPSTLGSFILMLILPTISWAGFWLRYKLQRRKHILPKKFPFWIFIPNLVCAFLLTGWITEGLEGNLIGFFHFPVLGFMSFMWLHLIRNCDG